MKKSNKSFILNVDELVKRRETLFKDSMQIGDQWHEFLEGAIGGFGSHVNFCISMHNVIIANSIFKSLILSKDLYDNNVPLDRIIENIYDFFDK